MRCQARFRDTDVSTAPKVQAMTLPTPIAMPGKASIRAALNPTEGDWKYYVLIDADGHHAFANTFAEHEANVAIARAKGLVP